MTDAYNSYKNTCRLLSESLIKIKSAKDANDKSIDGLKADCMYYFALLRKYNCKTQTQCKRLRDSTHVLRKKLDSTDLILKNLQFEEIYLQREIQKCLNFKSIVEDLHLIPEDDFNAHLKSKNEVIPTDKHAYTMKRLEWELEQRKILKTNLESWQAKRDGLMNEITELRDYLSSLPPQLEELLSSTAQVQDTLGLKVVHRKQQAELAAWLPSQLYNIYSQAIGYSEVSELALVVSVNGDGEKAKHLNESQSDDESLSEPEVKLSKRRSVVDQGKKKLFKTHPLYVEVVVPCDQGVHAKVHFNYLLKLRVVAVSISLMISTNSPWRDKFSVGTDYMSSKELLCALWPGDYGDESPNPEITNLINKHGLPSKTKIPNSIGRPFRWAQRLAGITGFSENDALDVRMSSDTIEPFVESIRARCLTRLSLKYQYRNLTANMLVKEGSIVQPTVISELTSWKELNYEMIPNYAFLDRARELGMFSEKDTLYDFAVRRGKTSCNGVMSVSLEYPNVPPFIVLEIITPDGKRTAANDENVKSIEHELNIFIDDLYDGEKGYLITKLINKLCMCVDVYTEGSGLEPQIKFFMNKFKGPNNILPYVFNAERLYFQHR